MQKTTHYKVAKNMRTDQRAMLNLLTVVNSEKIRIYCFETLLKDGILKPDSAYSELTLEDLLK